MKTKLIHSGSSASLASYTGKNREEQISYFTSNQINNNPDTNDGDEFQPNFCQRIFRRKNVERTFPILKWLPKYTKKKAISDLIAGVTVGLTVLPQGLAYATVAGLPPIYGLYSSFVGCFVYIFMGSTKAITIGPTAIQSVLTHKYTFGKSPQYAVFLAAVTAVVTSIMGIFRLGFIANFISSPVISGFTSGVALTITATQLKPLLGIKFDDEGFLPSLIGVANHIDEVRFGDAIMSLICCSTLLFLKYLQFFGSCLGNKSKVVDKILWLISTAKSAIVIIVCSVICAVYFPKDLEPFSLVGHINPGLPAFTPPPVTIFDPHDNRTHYFVDILKEEASALLVLPLLGVMGHITIAKAFSGTERVDCTQEIINIAVSNSISCFFSSMPIGGSFSRTTVNAMSGVETPLGGLYTGVMVVLALQFLTPYFFFIPKPSLASVITCSVIFMVDLSIIMPLYRSKKMDLIPWGLTFIITLLVGLEFGILTGLSITTLYLIYYASRPKVKILSGELSGEEFLLIELDRSLTFACSDYVIYEVSKVATRFANKSTPIVIDFKHIQFCDFAAAKALHDMISSLNVLDYTLIFYQVKPSILRIIAGVFYNTKVVFVYCRDENDLENYLKGHQNTPNTPASLSHHNHHSVNDIAL